MGKSYLWTKIDMISLMVSVGAFHAGDEKWIRVCCIGNSLVKVADTLEESDHDT